MPLSKERRGAIRDWRTPHHAEALTRLSGPIKPRRGRPRRPLRDRHIYLAVGELCCRGRSRRKACAVIGAVACLSPEAVESIYGNERRLAEAYRSRIEQLVRVTEARSERLVRVAEAGARAYRSWAERAARETRAEQVERTARELAVARATADLFIQPTASRCGKVALPFNMGRQALQCSMTQKST